MNPLARWAGGLLLAVGCSAPAPPLRHEVYVWQRVWTPAVRSAVMDSASTFDERVVLAVESDRGHTVWTGMWSLDGKPRVDPASAWVPDGAALDGGVGLALRWSDADEALAPGRVKNQVMRVLGRADAAGWAVSSVHLDADIPTARLAEWAQVVGRVAQWSNVPVRVLSLVDHVDRPGWDALGDAADGVVLQVHSVPLDGPGEPVLLDLSLATRALRAAVASGTGSLSVALPTHTLTHAQTGAAVRASPADVAPWLSALAADRPPTLRAVMWFRLPVPGDDTTWTAATLAEVRAGHLPDSGVRVRIEASGDGPGAVPGVAMVWVDSVGVDHVKVPSVKVCSSSGRIALATVDLRSTTERTSDLCWVAHPRDLRWIAPGQSEAVALVVSEAGASLSGHAVPSP